MREGEVATLSLSASELPREGESVRGKSSKVAGSGFSPLCQNPQRNFPIFVAGAQQAPDEKLDQEKPQKYTRTHARTHTQTDTRGERQSVDLNMPMNFPTICFLFFRLGRKFAFHVCHSDTYTDRQRLAHTHTRVLSMRCCDATSHYSDVDPFRRATFRSRFPL